jgi:DNA adenine methylase
MPKSDNDMFPSLKKKVAPSPIVKLNTKRKIAFGWYGGKYSHLEWLLLPLLPTCHHYCEPFSGSAAVLLNREPSPVETYNDLDSEIANFFRVLRNDSDRLIRAIGLTPFSREEFATACEVDPALPPLERARRFYVRARQVRTGLAQTASLGRWANCKNTSRAGMGGAVSRWLGAVRDLPEIAERLLRVQIENRPAIEVIQLYDSPITLFYCDPPYVHSTRGDNNAYSYEMTDDEHRQLAEVLTTAQGMVAISNYECDLMNELYSPPKWAKFISAERTNHSTKDKRVEVLWVNYNPNRLLRSFWLMESQSMQNPSEILNQLLRRAATDLSNPAIKEKAILERIDYVCRQLRNQACVRLLVACLLAKLDRPNIDPRKPYTEIDSEDSFSGRTYDERYITQFINANRLPLNPTTAFLTPAFRNIDRPLTTEIEIIGRPRQLYRDTLQLLDDVYAGRVTAEDLLAEIIRILLMMRQEREARMATLLAALQRTEDITPLSSEEIVNLIEQHLKSKNSSRLPVLVVAAAYQSVGHKLGERALPLKSHNAADEQTGAMGDVEVCLENDERVVTAYEMKTRRVTIDDIDRALHKIATANNRIHNYIFITTDVIEEGVKNYAQTAYEQTGGTEIAILDCLGFLRHFLHFFHRSRLNFLDAYQELILTEPEGAVSQPLKELFLALRQAAETDE